MRALALAAALLLALSITAAVAGELCPPRAQQFAYLANKYLEMPTGSGVAGNGSLIELLTSERGTWTIVETLPNGTSCMRAFGQGWRNIEPKPEELEVETL